MQKDDIKVLPCREVYDREEVHCDAPWISKRNERRRWHFRGWINVTLTLLQGTYGARGNVVFRWTMSSPSWWQAIWFNERRVIKWDFSRITLNNKRLTIPQWSSISSVQVQGNTWRNSSQNTAFPISFWKKWFLSEKQCRLAWPASQQV